MRKVSLGQRKLSSYVNGNYRMNTEYRIHPAQLNVRRNAARDRANRRGSTWAERTGGRRRPEGSLPTSQPHSPRSSHRHRRAPPHMSVGVGGMFYRSRWPPPPGRRPTLLVFSEKGGTSASWRKGWDVVVTHTKGWDVAAVKTPSAPRSTLFPTWPTSHPFGDFCELRHSVDVPPFFSDLLDVQPFRKKGWHVAVVGVKNPKWWDVELVGRRGRRPTILSETAKGWDVDLVADKADVQPFLGTPWTFPKRVERRPCPPTPYPPPPIPHTPLDR